jgi:hypothetical protein
VANKTNLSIGAVIILLIAAYFGIDLQENQLQTSTPSVAVEPSTQTSKPQNQVFDGTAKIAQAFQTGKVIFKFNHKGVLWLCLKMIMTVLVIKNLL